MKTLFLDAGYVIALEASDDQNHKAASQHWRKLLKSSPQLMTTSYVFDELVTFFNSRGRHEKAVEVGINLIQTNSIELIHVDEAMFYEGWEYFQKHGDKKYSLTDCVSFVVMKQRGIKSALTFDRHFAQAGFEKLP
jgi:predicted nucleic acid-binding protein